MKKLVVPVALGVSALFFAMSAPLAAQATTQSVSTWAALEAAFNAVTPGQSATIQLGANIATTGHFLDVNANGGTGGASITLDLHGHSLNINADGAGHSAIGVTAGASLVIEDTVGAGVLTATSDHGAGIGGWAYNAYVNSGSITITSGTVIARSHGSDPYAAGIGTGYEGMMVGNIVISGGNVTSTGDDAGAGIGVAGWESCGYPGVHGSIQISGGTVTAQGGLGAAGIGGGLQGCSPNISISGGHVTATGGARYQQDGGGAGIGTGSTSVDNPQERTGSISLSGGTVVAQGGTGSAGIGAGYGNGSTTALPAVMVLGCVEIHATGGSDAMAGSGAGIGTGGVFGSGSSIGSLSLPGTLTSESSTTTAAGAFVSTAGQQGLSFALTPTGSTARTFVATAIEGTYNSSSGEATGGRFDLACQSDALPDTGSNNRASTAVAIFAVLALLAGGVIVGLTRSRRSPR